MRLYQDPPEKQNYYQPKFRICVKCSRNIPFDSELCPYCGYKPEKFANLQNYGGFTDGDRAVFIADHFKAKKIFLIGFDFNDDVGRYSFTKNKEHW